MMYETIKEEIRKRSSHWQTAQVALKVAGLTDEQIDDVIEMMTEPIRNVMGAASDAGMITDDEYDSLHDMMADVFR